MNLEVSAEGFLNNAVMMGGTWETRDNTSLDERISQDRLHAIRGIRLYFRVPIPIVTVFFSSVRNSFVFSGSHTNRDSTIL